MRPTIKILGGKMKAAREQRYLTQRELAQMVGISSERMGSIEQSDVTGIDKHRVPRFAAALKISEAEFVEQIGAHGETASVKRNRSVLADLRAEAKRWGMGERDFYEAVVATFTQMRGEPAPADARGSNYAASPAGAGRPSDPDKPVTKGIGRARLKRPKPKRATKSTGLPEES